MKNAKLIAPSEMLKLREHLLFFAENNPKFISILNKLQITSEELLFRNIFQERSKELILKILENPKTNSLEKANFLRNSFSKCHLTRNIMELAILSYRTEFQKNEKIKLQKNTKGFSIGKEKRICYKCGRNLREFQNENEQVVIFQYCQHFVHVDCEAPHSEDEEFICKVCLKTKQAENNKKPKF